MLAGRGETQANMASSRTLFLQVFLLLLGGSVLGRLTEDSMAELDSFVQKTMSDGNVPGLSVVMVKDNSVLVAKGYGVKNIDSGEPVTKETLFPIASITKGMTSLLTAKKFHDRRWSLDEPLKQIYPDFMMPDRYRTEHACMRDLLAHRMCLDCGDLQFYAKPYPSRNDFAWRMRYCAEVCPFRTAFVYNNNMYGLAGSIVSSLWGRSWEDLITEDLFLPIGMTSTTFMEKRYMDQATLDNTAMSYVFNGFHQVPMGDIFLKPHVSHEGPAASVLSNAEDMGKWLMFLLAKGKNATGDRIVEEEVVNSLFAASMTTGNPLQNYGLGFLVTEYNGQFAYAHGGDYLSYFCLLTLYPRLGVGIFTMANGGANAAPQNSIQLHLLQQFSGIEKTNDFFPGSLDDILFETPTGKLGTRLPVTGNMDTRPPKVGNLGTRLPTTGLWTRKSLSPGEHVYGNLLFGNITLKVSNETDDVNLEYGETVRATLLPSSDPARFTGKWIGPLKYFMNSFYFDVLFGWDELDESVPDILILQERVFLQRNDIEFRYHLQLSDGPTQPWDNNSC